MTRQIILDTETTGLSPQQGHRVIEIGCVELNNRDFNGNSFHRYLNPQCAISPGAQKVHGITLEFLQDKPVFADIYQEFFAYLQGAELIIHNAPFDVGFLEYELRRVDKKFTVLSDHCQITDTLTMAREMHPGQKNNLDALAKRYSVDTSARELHGALLDAQILAQVYLAMTGGQMHLFQSAQSHGKAAAVEHLDREQLTIPVIQPSAEELAAHQAYLTELHKQSGSKLWRED